ncbi:hypothetical protein [Rossellomorea sp. LjRoot5]|uniref:hypothetical protein n=1 Tax=Rossellomorea sp. LjRoot5 TaxID=3342331 RepID=UPI003ECE6F39
MKLEQLLTLVTTSNHDTQTYHAKRMAELMVQIFESVVALKDAYTFGGIRKRMIADIFIKQTWRKTEWIDEEMKSFQYFDEIVGGK